MHLLFKKVSKSVECVCSGRCCSWLFPSLKGSDRKLPGRRSGIKSRSLTWTLAVTPKVCVTVCVCWQSVKDIYRSHRKKHTHTQPQPHTHSRSRSHTHTHGAGTGCPTNTGFTRVHRFHLFRAPGFSPATLSLFGAFHLVFNDCPTPPVLANHLISLHIRGDRRALPPWHE